MRATDQLFLFARCVLVGFAVGVIYEIFSVLRWMTGCKTKSKRVLTAVFDICFFVIFAIFAVFSASAFGFAAFRAYMAVGYGLGLILYLKSLHRILDFFEKVCYNILKKAVKRRKKNKKTEKTLIKKVGGSL